jgi:tetratricopeptide (TPR) repeat protein
LALAGCSRDPQVVKKKYLESGNKYFDRAKYKEASIMYRRALMTDQKYGEAWFKLAMTALKLNQPANAVPALRRAAEGLPKFSKDWNEANLNLAEILLLVAQQTDNELRSKPLIDEVTLLAKEFLDHEPGSLEGHKLTADLQIGDAARLYRQNDIVASKGAVEKGIKEYRASLAARPADSKTSLALARALALYGETGEAEQLFRTAIDKDPTTVSPYIELYRIYIGLKKLPEAEALLKKAIAANPKDFNFRTILAAHYFSNGNKAEGVKILDEMKANVRDFPRAYLTAGDFYLRVKDTANAIKSYEEGEQKDKPHKVDYQKRIIEVYTQQGKMAQAYEKNLEILKDNPKDPESRGLKATFLLDKGDVNQAINELQAVVTARPDNFVARFQLGRAHFAKNEYEQARQQFEKAIQLRPDYLPPRIALAQVSLARGDNDTALKTAQDAMKINPSSNSARLLEASAMMRMGNFKESQAAIQAILAQNPKQPETLLEYGVLYLLEKKFDDAAKTFRQAYEGDPANLRGLTGQAEALFQMDRKDEAIRMIQAEVARFPNRNDIKRTLGDAYFRVQRFDEGVKTYESLVPSYKDNPKLQGDLYARIGDAYVRKNDRNAALPNYRKAHELEPDSTSVINALALLYENLGKHDEARKLYQESISRKADDPAALNNLAYLTAETGGNLDEALTLATRAKQKQPNSAEISDTVGWIYLKKNLPDSAIDIFKELSEKNPGVATYHYHYAMALMQKGDKLGSAKECKEALKATPKDKEEEDLIRSLLARVQ